MERPKYLRKPSSSSLHGRRSGSRRHSRRRSSSSHSINNHRIQVDPNVDIFDSPFGSSNEPELNEIRAVLDNTLPLDYFKQDIISVVQLLRIPKWRKIQLKEENLKHLELKRISGALTNCVYRVSYKNYYPLLLRLYGANVENIIDRKKELLTLQKLSERNIGPKLLGCFTNGRFEEFLNNSVTLNKDMIKDPKISRMIARRMKELHVGIPLDIEESLKGSAVWNTIEKWVALVDDIIEKCNGTVEEQKAIFLVDWSTFKSLIFKYRDWLYAKYEGKINIDTRLRFCHNDTQYGNLMFYNKFDQMIMTEDDDEEVEENEETYARSKSRTSLSVVSANDVEADLATQISSLNMSASSANLPTITDMNIENDKKLVVIDFEYAGPNIAAYDITNHFNEWMADYHQPDASHKIYEDLYPTKDQRLNLLSAYVSFTPGSQTPRIPGRLTSSSSVADINQGELPKRVVQLYNETILWRPSNSIFWMLWGVITKGTIKKHDESLELKDIIEIGPNGERYRIVVDETLPKSDSDKDTSEEEDDVEEINDDNDDNFDYLGYSLEKIGLIFGDFLQLGLVEETQIQEDDKKYIKILDCEMLAVAKET